MGRALRERRASTLGERGVQMALSGDLRTSTWHGSTQSGSLVFNWAASQDQSKNQSTISWYIAASVSSGYIVYSELYVRINGDSVYYRGPSTHTNASNGTVLASGTEVLTHDANGACSFSVSIGAGIYNWAVNVTGSDTFYVNTLPVYSLSMSVGAGCSVSVNRTSSGYAANGRLSDGAKLYKGDTLKITFTPNANHAISKHNVNGAAFSSGGTHTVSGNVGIEATAKVLASSVGATDADIGSISTVTVTKYNDSYYHSLSYKFGGLTGYIKPDGSTSASEVKFQQTGVAFTVPESFYGEIPNAKSAYCVITCKTYSSQKSVFVLGSASSCKILVTATGSPTVDGAVTDINTVTTSLTGNSSTLIRYKSTAKCVITANPQHSSTISSKYINGSAPDDNACTFSNVSDTKFVFQATDSRGYTSEKIVAPTIIAYVKLTCNPIITRVSPASDTCTISITGDFFRGSFGVYSNTLSIKYRFRKASEATFGQWQTLPSTSYTIGASSYNTNGAVELAGAFDYKEAYVFQINATDGANGVSLSSVTKNITMQRGIPVFDWGENDFNFHVPVKIGDTTLTEDVLTQLIALLPQDSLLLKAYPVGSIYISANSADPGTLFGGVWKRIKDTFLLAAGDSYAAGATGGEAAHTLINNEMPSHTHLMYSSNGGGEGTWTPDEGTYLVDSVSTVKTTWWARLGMNAAGGGAAHNNMPPYLTVYVWKRTA